MATEKEIALEQALVALIGAVRLQNLEDKALIDQATTLLIDNSVYRWVGHPHVENAAAALSEAHATALSLESSD